MMIVNGGSSSSRTNGLVGEWPNVERVECILHIRQSLTVPRSSRKKTAGRGERISAIDLQFVDICKLSAICFFFGPQLVHFRSIWFADCC